MALFSKDNLLKFFAIIIVLGFLTELFAVYQNGNSNLPTDTNPGGAGANATPLFGIAVVNATVTSYEDALGASIRAEGNSSLIQAEAAKLRSQGLVTYVSQDKNALVLSVPRGANFTKVVESLSALNATLTARADVTLKDLPVFYTENGTVTLPIKNIRISIDPAIPTGYVIGLKITASLTQDSILESVYEVIPVQMDILTVAEVSKLYPDYSAIAVLEWAGRDIDKNATGIYLSQKFSNVSVLTITNNTVAFSKAIGPGTIASIYSLNLSYLRNFSTRQLLFYTNFTDNARLEKDVGPALSAENITLIYPPSYARIDFVTDNFSQEFLNSSINAAAVFVYRKSTLMLGTSVADEGGKEYIAVKRDFTDYYPYMNETGATKLVSIKASILGNKIVNYTVNQE